MDLEYDLKSLSVKTFFVIVVLVLVSLGVITFNNTEYLRSILENHFRDSAMSALEREGIVLEGTLARLEREMPDIISNYYEDLDIKGTPNLENQMVNSDFDITHFQIIALDSKKPKTLAYIVKNGIKTKKRSFEKANLRSVARYISKKKAQFIFELNKGDRNFVTLARSYKVDQREDRIFVVLGLRKSYSEVSLKEARTQGVLFLQKI